MTLVSSVSEASSSLTTLELSFTIVINLWHRPLLNFSRTEESKESSQN